MTMARSLLLETNLLLFYLVAQVDLTLLQSFKRVSNLKTSDLQPLRDLVEAFSLLVTTPHILTEVSNFIDQAPQHWRLRLIDALRSFVVDSPEYFEASRVLVNKREFAQLALADVSLLSLSHTAVIATLDYELFQRIAVAGGQAVHLDHVRGEAAPRRANKPQGKPDA